MNDDIHNPHNVPESALPPGCRFLTMEECDVCRINFMRATSFEIQELEQRWFEDPKSGCITAWLPALNIFSDRFCYWGGAPDITYATRQPPGWHLFNNLFRPASPSAPHGTTNNTGHTSDSL